MKTLNEFKIPFVGLKDGKHQFDYQIDKKFFDAFEYEEFDQINFKVKIELNKKTTMMELFFSAEGTVKVPCDLTGEEFDLIVKGELPLIVKFGESFNDENEELLVIPHGAFEIELHQYVYELILLSIPQKRVKPGVVEVNSIEDTDEIEKELKAKENKDEQVDPRWDQLKQLLDKK